MSDYVKIEKATMDDIGGAIIEKGGADAPLLPSEMRNGILNIPGPGVLAMRNGDAAAPFTRIEVQGWIPDCDTTEYVLEDPRDVIAVIGMVSPLLHPSESVPDAGTEAAICLVVPNSSEGSPAQAAAWQCATVAAPGTVGQASVLHTTGVYERATGKLSGIPFAAGRNYHFVILRGDF